MAHSQDKQIKYIICLLVQKRILLTVEKGTDEQCPRRNPALCNQRIKA